MDGPPPPSHAASSTLSTPPPSSSTALTLEGTDNSEEILDHAISLSSAVVSDEQEEEDVEFSNNLLIIASSSSSSSPTVLPTSAPLAFPPPVRPSSSSSTSAEARMRSRISLASSDDEDEMGPLLRGVRGKRKEDKLTYFGFTKKQWLTLVIFAFANIFSTTVISIQAPFYPKEAEEKGATPTEYGLVFGIFQLTMFLASPIYGTLLGTINPKLMFNLGIFTTGTCAILFGFLDKIDDRVTFIALSFAIRIIQACGDSAFVTASFTIIALEFPDSIATTFAALETCSGLGLILGPTIGAALYEIGGFLLPFLSMGGLLFLTAVLTYFILPTVSVVRDPELISGSKGFGFFSLVRIPAVAVAAFSIAISASSIGFLNATLEPHLRDKFELTPIYTGLIFIIDGGMYAISAPIWGRLCDKSSQPKVITLVGCMLTFIGFLFVGPAPFMPFDTILWVTCVGLVIHGLGVGASLVAGFIQAMQDAVDSGFPDNVATYGLVSGMWIAFFALGNFVGPSVGGLLLENFGFQLGSTYVLATQVLIAFFTLLFICTNKAKRSKYPDIDPLLTNKNLAFSDQSADHFRYSDEKPSSSRTYGAA